MNTLQERKLSVSQLNPLQRSSVFVLFCFVYLMLVPVSVHANPESVIKSILCSQFWVTHKLIFFKCLLDHCFSHNAPRSPGYCSALGTHKLRLRHSFPNYAVIEPCWSLQALPSFSFCDLCVSPLTVAHGSSCLVDLQQDQACSFTRCLLYTPRCRLTAPRTSELM